MARYSVWAATATSVVFEEARREGYTLAQISNLNPGLITLVSLTETMTNFLLGNFAVSSALTEEYRSFCGVDLTSNALMAQVRELKNQAPDPIMAKCEEMSSSNAGSHGRGDRAPQGRNNESVGFRRGFSGRGAPYRSGRGGYAGNQGEKRGVPNAGAHNSSAPKSGAAPPQAPRASG